MESAPPPPAPPHVQVLPGPSELSPHHVEFLDQNLTTHQDLLTRAPLLLSGLETTCSDFDAHLLSLQRNLTRRAVSWISRSFSAKTSIGDLNLSLENLNLRTCQYGFGLKRIQRAVDEELPQLARQMRQIESIQKYVDTALKLEVLVGDLEDVVFSIADCRIETGFSAKLFTSLISKDFLAKQGRFLKAAKLMNDIEELLVEVVKFHPRWHHLLESVDSRVDKTLAVVRPQVLADHRALLASLGWPPNLLASKSDSGEIIGLPNPLILMAEEKRRYYSHSFLALCALQHLQTRRKHRLSSIYKGKHFRLDLWAIDELVSPIASKMECHFSKWTEQPEFIFALVYKITRDFIVGVDDVLQPLIDRERLVSYSAKEAWVSAMVEMLSGFLEKRVFSVLADRYKDKHMKSEVVSSWLHLIDLALIFDKRMQSLLSSETYLFVESESSEGLSGGPSTLSIIFKRPDWLKLWAKVELKDAWKKLKSELKNERAWLIDKRSGITAESEQFLLSTREDHKAPPVAESALKLAWEIIDRCQNLPLVYRAQFIRSSASRFLWCFLNVLVLRCKNIEFNLNYLDDTLFRMCGSINAARYVQSKLQEWNDNIKFLEMRIAENDSGGNLDGVNSSCFFREEIESLEELETNWLMEIIAVLLRQFETLSWEYLQDKLHLDLKQEELASNGILSPMDVAVSGDIAQALDTLRSQLDILKLSLNTKDFLDLWRGIADGLDHFISRSIFMNDGRLSNVGINQFGIDMKALFHVFKPFCARPEAFLPWIRETLVLLNMSWEEVNCLLVDLSKNKCVLKSLHSYGISHLSSDQVDKILRKGKSAT